MHSYYINNSDINLLRKIRYIFKMMRTQFINKTNKNLQCVLNFKNTKRPLSEYSKSGRFLIYSVIRQPRRVPALLMPGGRSAFSACANRNDLLPNSPARDGSRNRGTALRRPTCWSGWARTALCSRAPANGAACAR